jgi:FkbM family methyltransferase
MQTYLLKKNNYIKNIQIYNSNLTKNDKFVNYIFENKKNGYYVEAGACDGIKDSNTYFFDKYLNWSGILVEPSNLYNNLCINRPNAKCFNCCIGKENKEIEFTEFAHEGYNQLSCTNESLDKLRNDTLYSRALNESYIINKKIQLTTLDDIFDKVNAPNIIEYISLDVEGSEEDVIEGINFNKRKILLISAERLWSNKKLENLGYKKIINPFDESGNPVSVTWLPENNVHPWDCWWVSPELLNSKKDIINDLVYQYYNWDTKQYIK